jgi:hypothetical protein
MSVTYWVYDPDDHAGSKTDSGYVGVTEDPEHRLHSLRSAGIVPRHAEMKILFQGSRIECLMLEKQLRPRRNIGWNKAVGGVAPARMKHGYASYGPKPFPDEFGPD